MHSVRLNLFDLLEIAEHFVQTFETLFSLREFVAEATFQRIHTDFHEIQDLKWFQETKAGTRLADNIPIGTWVSGMRFLKINLLRWFLHSTDLSLSRGNLIEKLLSYVSRWN